MDEDLASHMYLPKQFRAPENIYQRVKAQAVAARVQKEKNKSPLKTPLGHDPHQDSLFTQRKITTDETYLGERKSIKTTERMTPISEANQAPATERPTL